MAMLSALADGIACNPTQAMSGSVVDCALMQYRMANLRRNKINLQPANTFSTDISQMDGTYIIL
jgi:hypothetical protein